MVLFLLLIVSLLSPCHGATVCNQDDQGSILSFSSYLSSPLNWDPSTDCCLREGVDCNETVGGRVTIEFFSSLSSLQVLDLSYNHLDGELPSVDTSNLIPITISFNSFLRAAWNLSKLNVSNNSFTSQIPSKVCHISLVSITLLDFSSNNFSGNLTPKLGECSKLEIFHVGFNNLSGMILMICTKQHHFDVVVNLTNLQVLKLYSNQFSSKIPRDIGKLSKLEWLLLHINNLAGPLPPSLMNCTNLVKLNLQVNFLSGNLSNFDFSTLPKLTTLDLGNNNFACFFPTSLYSCTSLVAVKVINFVSFWPKWLKHFIPLKKRDKTRSISSRFKFMLQKFHPNISRNIPIQLDSKISRFCPRLQTLWSNAFLASQQVIELSYNKFKGSIPGWLGNLPSLFYLDLSNNLFEEVSTRTHRLQALASQEAVKQVDRSYLELPVSVKPTNATNLQYNQLSSLPPALYLQNNNLSGNIPIQIGQLKFLHVLDLSGNRFFRNILDQLSNLTNLEKFDLSGNELFGEIPASLSSLHFLLLFNVANNELQEPVPSGGQFDIFPSSSFVGNTGLCGQVLRRSYSNSPGTNHSSAPHKSTNIKLVIGLVGIYFGTALFISVLALWILSKRRIIYGGDTDITKLDTISINSIFPLEGDKDANLVVLFPNNSNEIKDLTISKLLKANDNFNHANIVGRGGFGMVYKATLEDGSKLAVKKLFGDLGLMEREFRAEVDALSTAQHENLVSLRGYCVHEGLHLLIYSFMENESLDYCRLWTVPMILPYHTHVTTELVGTLGYIPPEYGQAWVATLRGDIYNFGRPMEVFNPKMSRELVGWVQQMRNKGKQNEVFDPLLTGKGFDDEMLQVLDVACMCVSQNLSRDQPSRKLLIGSRMLAK
ncbi:tyrosine-sulfated glycopeptide receptor [Salix suchowensis]|nr:tyrosine-sulfated glycopeptide receptor [Salix suchowensis]